VTSGDGIAELRAAEKAAALLRGLVAQRDTAQSIQTQAAERVQQARAKLTDEQADLGKLESMSMARILSAVKGNREADLQQEQADVQAAEYSVAEAEERFRTADAELEAIRDRIAELGDVAAQGRRAVELREQALLASGGEVAERLSVLARTTGEAEARHQQLTEASHAAEVADQRLRAAAELLGSASSWAIWDTFGGGGLITDSIKYDRMDRAAGLMRAADAALAHLSRELADVGVAGAGGIEVTELNRTFDVWFDNMFSDWSVRNRIAEASDRVQQMIGWIGTLQSQLQEKTRQVSAELASAEQERAGLRSF
jgi:hypothetical protein